MQKVYLFSLQSLKIIAIEDGSFFPTNVIFNFGSSGVVSVIVDAEMIRQENGCVPSDLIGIASRIEIFLCLALLFCTRGSFMVCPELQHMTHHGNFFSTVSGDNARLFFFLL